VRNIPVGAGPHVTAVGDFDRDGRLDVAVALRGTGDVAILLGNGDGTFQRALAVGTGGAAELVVADFNGDRVPDLAVTGGSLSSVNVLLGIGDGTFQPPLTSGAGRNPSLVATGDFDGDGNLDLVFTNNQLVRGENDKLSMALGHGDGTFQLTGTFDAGSVPHSAAAADFNGDGKLDLAAANAGGRQSFELETANTVSVYLGNGNGTLQEPEYYRVGGSPFSTIVADFNGDGALDIVTGNVYGIGSVTVLLGNHDGTFQAVRVIEQQRGPWSVALGDFNGDSRPDLALGIKYSNTVAILTNVC
jgi:hypothetical protein